MAWTDAARKAAAEARAAKAAQNAKQNSAKNRTADLRQQALAQKYANRPKPGPQTSAHPNPANRVAFGPRNKMIHDAGKPARMAAHQAKLRAATMGSAGAGLLKALLGLGAGAAGAFLRSGEGGGRR
jgi:hypothetical protein